MRRHLIRTLLVCGATTAAVVLGSSQVFAANTVTITFGGTFMGTRASNYTLTDNNSGVRVTCTSGNLTADFGAVASAALPYNIAKTGGGTGALMAFGVGACTSSLGTATVTTSIPDDVVINAVPGTFGFNADGYIQNHAGANAAIVTVSVLTCTFQVSGQAPFAYTSPAMPNGNGQLQVNPGVMDSGGTGLTINNVSAGCFGMVSNGDSLNFAGAWAVNPAPTITTP
ncbi:MAG TPA: hypothetical protein VFW65_02140 [Pseudonocardiaceae bacterium]|nr:hypothetical protein [Pseudonocardiaceae bacterium]